MEKLNRRSLQDDAFDAEELITRRNRVAGQEFTDQIEDEMFQDPDKAQQRDESAVTPQKILSACTSCKLGQIPHF